jgi:hypothetical protein
MKHKVRLSGRSCLLVSVVVIIFILGSFLAVARSPMFGAEGADILRSIFGEKFVAYLETVVFEVQDHVTHWEYSLGWIKPSIPQQYQSTPFGWIPASTTSVNPAVLTPEPPMTKTVTSTVQPERSKYKSSASSNFPNPASRPIADAD